MALQTEEALELAYEPFYDLALARSPAPIGLRPRPAGVVLGRRSDERPVLIHPKALPLYPREAFVGQVGSVAVGGHESIAYGPLVGGCLAAEEPLARSPHPHHRRDEGRVHNAIDGRRLGELLGEGELQEAHLWLQGSDATVELALRTEGREVGAQVRRSEAPEVPLAVERRPLGEYGQGDDLRIAEQGRPTALRRLRGALELPPVVHEDVQ